MNFSVPMKVGASFQEDLLNDRQAHLNEMEGYLNNKEQHLEEWEATLTAREAAYETAIETLHRGQKGAPEEVTQEEGAAEVKPIKTSGGEGKKKRPSRVKKEGEVKVSLVHPPTQL